MVSTLGDHRNIFHERKTKTGIVTNQLFRDDDDVA